MKVFRFAIAMSLTLAFMGCANAVSLIGTTNIVYQPILYTFADGDQAVGAVFLNGGFKVNPGQGVRMNLYAPVRSVMDLSSTGSIILENNLQLDAGTFLSDGGIVNGGGYTLSLNCDITIPSLATLIITSTLAINGNGHTIFLDDYGQILVDTHSTLTLRNLIIQNSHNPVGHPPIACNGYDSKLALENVILNLSNDFWFNQGSLFIHDEVIFSGNFKFVYRSAQASFVAPGSTMLFDLSSGLYYYPSISNNSLINMQDYLSSLYFNCSSLTSTPTWLGLSQGRVLFDDAIQIETGVSPLPGVSSLGTFEYFSGSHSGPLGSSVASVAWSFDGRYLAVGGQRYAVDDSFVKIYEINSADLRFSLITEVSYGTSASTKIKSLVWSYDGNHLAVGGANATSAGGFDNTDELRIYSFDKGAGVLTPVTSRKFGTSINSVTWHNSDKFVAIGGTGAVIETSGFNDTNNLRIYSFDSSYGKLLPFASYDFGIVNTVKWRFLGDYLAVGGQSTAPQKELKLFSFDSTGLDASRIIRQVYAIDFGSDVASIIYDVDWSGDGRYLAVAGNKPTQNPISGLYEYFQVYEFDPTVTTTLSYFCGDPILFFPLPLTDEISPPRVVSWNSDGSGIVTGNINNSIDAYPFLRGFSFDSSMNGTDTILRLCNTWNINFASIEASSVAWNPVFNVFALGTSYLSPSAGCDWQAFNLNGESNRLVTSRFYSDAEESIGNGVTTLSWSRDGKYIAIAGTGPAANDDFNNTNKIRVYKFDKTKESLSPVASVDPGAGTIYSVEWSPSGEYLAVAYDFSILVYALTSGSLTLLALYSTGAGELNNVTWHPSGKYFATLHYQSSVDYSVQVYSFDGVSINLITGVSTVVAHELVKWSPDGNYIVAYGSDVNNSKIYKFNNFSSLSFVTDMQPAIKLDWRMDSKYILYYDGSLKIGDFSGASVSIIWNYGLTECDDIKFTSDGTGFAKIENNSIGNYNSFYSFSDDIKIQEIFHLSILGVPQIISYSPDGKYAAIGLTDAKKNVPDLFIQKINKLADKMDNNLRGLLINPGIEVKVLSGANVQVGGIVSYT